MLSVMSAMVVVRRSPPAHACQTPDASLAADRYFVSLTRPDVGFNVIYLRASLPTFKPRDRAARTADGILIVLVVDAIDAEYERLTAAGTAILTTIETEEWGERYFQVEDPNGVIVQLVQWIAAPPPTPSYGNVRPLVTGATRSSAADVPPRAAGLVPAQFDTVVPAAEGCDALVATGMVPAGTRR